MEALKVFIIYILLVAIFLGVGDVDGKRGGSSRGSSSRGSSRGRSRSSYGGSYGGSRTFSHVPLSGRILVGSSIFTALTWRAAASNGRIYGGHSYLSRYSGRHDMPTICTNNYEKSPEGNVYGYFICPRWNENSSYIYCCGAERKEYCCDMDMAQEYLAQQSQSGISAGAIAGIVVVILAVIGVCVYCIYKKRKTAGVIIRRFTKKDTTRHAENGTQAVPLNGPVPVYNGIAPEMPPPAYDAITPPKPGYGDSNDLPYGPPQPQPPNYDEKSCLPPPDIDRPPQPYWTPYPPTNENFSYPVSNETPYPPSDSMPYPPPNSAPYQFIGDAPYPPPNTAPYPPLGEAPYPPADGTPYPLVGGVPYPPEGGAPYPPEGGAPYPPMGATPYPYQGAGPDPSPSIASAPESSEDPSSKSGAAYHLNSPAGGKHQY